jgi:hypothetical protein
MLIISHDVQTSPQRATVAACTAPCYRVRTNAAIDSSRSVHRLLLARSIEHEEAAQPPLSRDAQPHRFPPGCPFHPAAPMLWPYADTEPPNARSKVSPSLPSYGRRTVMLEVPTSTELRGAPQSPARSTIPPRYRAMDASHSVSAGQSSHHRESGSGRHPGETILRLWSLTAAV